MVNLIYILKIILFIYFFREKGREEEREGEKHQFERETSIGSNVRRPGTKPTT